MSRQRILTGKPWETTVAHSPGIVASGRLLYTSGITARDKEGKLVGPNDMKAQIEQVYRNLSDIFAAAGTGWDKVVKLTWYATDIHAAYADKALWNKFHVANPGSTLIEIPALVIKEMTIEVEAVVALD